MNCQDHGDRGMDARGIDARTITRRWFFEQCGAGVGADALAQRLVAEYRRFGPSLHYIFIADDQDSLRRESHAGSGAFLWGKAVCSYLAGDVALEGSVGYGTPSIRPNKLYDGDRPSTRRKWPVFTQAVHPAGPAIARSVLPVGNRSQD